MTEKRKTEQTERGESYMIQQTQSREAYMIQMEHYISAIPENLL